MKEVRNQFRKIAKVIEAQSAVAGGTGHAPTTGKLRELIVQNFLRPHLPKTLDIKSGVIIDAEGGRSTQQDCVIVDTRMPMVDVGSETEGLLIAESVVATIEIKSFLDKKELLSTLKACAITKSLKRNGEQIYSKGPAEIQIPKALPINTYIFAYDGLELNTIVGHMSDFATTKSDGGVIPEAACIMTKGVLLRSSLVPEVKGNHVTLSSIKDIKLTAQPYKEDALFAFYRRLIDDVMPLRMRIFDIDAYYAASDLE